MSDVYLIRGGPCIPLCLPFCGPAPSDRLSHLNYPTRVAGEYDRGRFTLGNTLDLLNNSRYRNAIAQSTIAVGDFISLVLIPEEHTYSDVFVRVNPDNYAASPVVFNPPKVTGVTFDVEVRIFNKDGVQQSSASVDGMDGVSMDTALTIRTSIEEGAGVYVETGQWAEVGLIVRSLPTTANAKFEDITSLVSLVVKVDDYQAPHIL